MIAKVAIPQEEIAHVQSGQPARLQLDAYPRRRWEAPIDKIHPRSEIEDEASVFVAEVPLDNTNGLLRPGMKGRAKVIGPPHPLAWNLFHKPWYKLAQWLGL